ncbi:MAG: hypothetical protein BWY76_02206 [bacterium ADurb.Bin429]|nr:MAG: hypothetical protein BWY76_02206 [bacterium ADurb.Bin429]
MQDAFFLAYGGLHWGYREVCALSLRMRAQFVEALERQLAYEREQLKGK